MFGMPWETDGKMIGDNENYEVWVNEDLTAWAKKPIGKTKGLTNVVVTVLRVKATGEAETYLIYDKDEPIYQNTSYEAVACWLDALKIARA